MGFGRRCFCDLKPRIIRSWRIFGGSDFTDIACFKDGRQGSVSAIDDSANRTFSNFGVDAVSEVEDGRASWKVNDLS